MTTQKLKLFFVILTIAISLFAFDIEKNQKTNTMSAQLNNSITNTKDIINKTETLAINSDTIFEQIDYLIKDLDNDKIKDSVYLNKENYTIVYKLSSNGFKEISSKPFETFNSPSGVTETKNGFEFYNDWMRSGYKNQFRYNAKTKKIQLIGISRYAFGNAANEGSGESSVNLLTSDYIGNWNYFDLEKNNLVKIPSIKTKMKYKTIYLEDFDEEINFEYAEKCAELYNKHKEKMIKNKYR